MKDTGIGIQKNYLQTIFERFKQVDEGDSRKYGGTGLGLAISKAIAELMGGTIWVDSEYGKGSVFYFTLSYNPMSFEKYQTKVISNKSKLNIDFLGKTFLIVEDDESSFFYLKTILEKNRATVVRAKNGKSAIEIVQTNSAIQLILMDMHLPEMTGCEASIEIKKINPKIPIIAQTADVLAESREYAMSCGLNEFITKPINP